MNPDVNMVSAPVVAKERGIKISTTNQDKSGAFEGYIKLTVVTDKRERSIAGTVFSRRQAALHPDQGHQHRRRDRGAYALHHQPDEPGIIGTLGQTMGERGVNIANFTLGRAKRAARRSRCFMSMRRLPRRSSRRWKIPASSNRYARWNSTWAEAFRNPIEDGPARLVRAVFPLQPGSGCAMLDR